VVKDKKKKSSSGSKCKCGCKKQVAAKDMYTMPCAERLGVSRDPNGVVKKAMEKRRIKEALMAEERLIAAGLSVNEQELGDDVIQALVIVIMGKQVTAFPEVYESLVHYMPTLFENKTPTLREAIKMSGVTLYPGYTRVDDMDNEALRFITCTTQNKNPVLVKMDGSYISRNEARKTFGFVSSVVYTVQSKVNARKVEATLQAHWEDLQFGYHCQWRKNDKGAKRESLKDVGKVDTVFLTISQLVQELIDGGELLINI